MKAAKQVSPEDYILAVLSPQERLEAAFNVAREAFEGYHPQTRRCPSGSREGKEKSLRGKAKESPEPLLTPRQRKPDGLISAGY